jgi:ADP-ribosylglycohydrolase
MTLRIPSIKNMDHLLEHLPYFQNQDNQFYEIINKPSKFPFASYSGIVDVFRQDLYNENMIQMFDWQEWSGEAERYFNDPELLSAVDLTTLQKLFTSIIRADRFCEGLLGEMLDNGVILNLLLRLQSIREEILDRFHGAILGLAVGDAMGVPLEFKDPGSFEPVNDMVGGGSFDLSTGMWTDDTSLALCLAESLIESGKFDPVDQLSRYLRWYQDGPLSVNNECFDIGNTTRQALMTFEETGEPYPGPDHEFSAGNGSLMRLAPVPIFFMSNPLEAVEKSAKSSRTTHNHPLAVDACRYFGGLIHGALIGKSKDEILSPRYSPIPGYWDEKPLAPLVDEVACGSFKEKEPPQIRGRGFVVKSLEAALWAFFKTETFEDGCLLAVNLGEDADTTGAIYGQLTGTYYAKSGIPKKWIDKLVKLDLIESLSERLLEVPA